MYQLPTLLHCQQRIRAVEEFDGVSHMVQGIAESRGYSLADLFVTQQHFQTNKKIRNECDHTWKSIVLKKIELGHGN